MGLPIARIISFWGSILGSPYLGNYHVMSGPIQGFRGYAFGLRVNRNTSSFSGSGFMVKSFGCQVYGLGLGSTVQSHSRKGMWD